MSKSEALHELYNVCQELNFDDSPQLAMEAESEAEAAVVFPLPVPVYTCNIIILTFLIINGAILLPP